MPYKNILLTESLITHIKNKGAQQYVFVDTLFSLACRLNTLLHTSQM